MASGPGVEIRPLPESVDPTLLVTLTIEFQYGYQVPLRVEGALYSEDKKLLCELVMLPDSSNAGRDAILPRPESNQPQQRRAFLFAARLSDRAIETVLRCRDSNKKKDIILRVSSLLTYFRPTFSVSHLNTLRVDSAKWGNVMGVRKPGWTDPRFVYWEPTERNAEGTDVNLVTLESTTSGVGFGEFAREVQNFSVTIPSSDWVQDFLPVFGLGRFLTLDLPIPEPASELDEKLERAVQALSKMDFDIQKGEWADCVEDSRPVWDLLKTENPPVESLITQSFPGEAGTDLLAAVRKLFTFVSTFVKPLDRDKTRLNPVTIPQKEEAYFVYSTSVTVVNLVAQKLRKK